jgi:hypothetical protein
VEGEQRQASLRHRERLAHSPKVWLKVFNKLMQFVLPVVRVIGAPA